MSYSIFLKSAGISFQAAAGQTILAAAQDAGGLLRHGCQAGACRLCRARLLKGKVEYRPGSRGFLSEAEIAENYFLPCCTVATSDIECEQDVWATGSQGHREGALLLNKERRGDVFVLILQLSGRSQIRPKPGQYVEVESACGARRAYSVSNIPQRDNRIELHVRRRQGGQFSHTVCETISVGDVLWIQGPYGDFMLQPDSIRPVLFIATGTGFSPIKAMLESGLLAREREIHLFWGGRTRADLYFESWLEALASRYDKFQFIPVLSQPDTTDSWSGRTGYVQDWIGTEIGDASGYDVYACGSPVMIRDVLELLTMRCSLPVERFWSDGFYSSSV